MTPLTIEQKQKDAAVNLLKDMKTTADSIRALIIGMPPKDLLGFIYAQNMFKMIAESGATSIDCDPDIPDDMINEIQFLLEYVHAVLASDVAPDKVEFDEAKCAELFALGNKLREQAMFFAIASSAGTENEDFGPNTADIEFHTKSSWIMLRGNRYQVLEGEFYSYVLTPHDDVLKETYGVGATEIGKGFQDMANATRSGQANAFEELMKQCESAHSFAEEQGKPLEGAIEAWSEENPDNSKAAWLASDDIHRGGIANVSHHTKLPRNLLSDLAYQRGEETEFFAEGDFAGTPYRTLPARKKPLIQIGSEYYAVDPCFTRDSGYRALLFNLLQRKPEYKKSFEDRQKIMSEGAFPDILSDQLSGATVYQEVYYKDPVTKQWSENDTLVLIDDVLFLVEAKAGAQATIASPALDFNRHAQSVKDLVLKAYKQCERFFNYLDSADEVPLYHLTAGRYKECGRVSRSDYRVMVPIGLTVESFTPFSSYCKELPQIEPLLGKHGFVSMSIDDLFVLNRILPTPGEFAHYMEVRQAVAGMRGAYLYDELDHLGAYITKNRFDQNIADQLKSGEANLVVWNGMCDVIDKSFEGENWETDPIPTQGFPDEVLKLLGALNSTRAIGWLSAESQIRNQGEQGRKELAEMLNNLVKTLNQRPKRYFIIDGDEQPIFIYLQSNDHNVEWGGIKDIASAAAIFTKYSFVFGLLVKVNKDGVYTSAQHFKAHAPLKKTDKNEHVFDEAKRMSQRMNAIKPSHRSNMPIPSHERKIGRNEKCPCGSGIKYKKCHGP